MAENIEHWKDEFEDGASKIVEAPEGEVEKAVHRAAMELKDAEYIGAKERSLDEITKDLKEIGWRYRGPLSHGEVYKATVEEKREILIVNTGAQKYIFEKLKESE